MKNVKWQTKVNSDNKQVNCVKVKVTFVNKETDFDKQKLFLLTNK